MNKANSPVMTGRRLVWVIPLFILSMLYLGGIVSQYIASLMTHGVFYKPTVFINPIVCIYASIAYSLGRACALGTTVLVTLAFLLSRWRDKVLNFILYTDERGVGFAKRGTYGTAKWLRESDLYRSKDMDLCSIEKTDGFILAQLDKNGKQVVSLKTKRKGNTNIAIIGGSGTGKSAGFVRANLLNAWNRNESTICTDPKGDILCDFYKLCEERGIPVRVFNLLFPEYSDGWDPMSEVVDPETGEASPDRAASFATVIIENTGSSKEAIWNEGPKNLIKAVALWALWRKETALVNAYIGIFTELEMGGWLSKLNPQWVAWTRNALSPGCNIHLKKRREVIEEALAHSDLEPEEREKLKSRYLDKVPEASIATVYQTLARYGENIGQLLNQMPDGHAGKIAYQFYEQAPEKVRSSFIQGLGVRLQLLQSQSLRRILRNQDINLADIGAKQTAVFVIIPDQDSSTRAISSMFFTFLFKDLADEFTRTQGAGRIPVNIILDEFANIGAIPDFSTKLTISRSRLINISYIIQDPSQITALYGPEAAKTIISSVETTLFLGSSDLDTCKMISERTGEATITVNTVRNTRGVGRVESLRKEYQESLGEGKRVVMTPHEIATKPYDECILFVGTNNVLKANKFWWWQHPDSNEGKLEKILISDLPRASEKYKATEGRDPFLEGAAPTFDLEDYTGDVFAVHSAQAQETGPQAAARHSPPEPKTQDAISGEVQIPPPPPQITPQEPPKAIPRETPPLEINPPQKANLQAVAEAIHPPLYKKQDIGTPAGTTTKRKRRPPAGRPSIPPTEDSEIITKSNPQLDMLSSEMNLDE